MSATDVVHPQSVHPAFARGSRAALALEATGVYGTGGDLRGRLLLMDTPRKPAVESSTKSKIRRRAFPWTSGGSCCGSLVPTRSSTKSPQRTLTSAGSASMRSWPLPARTARRTTRPSRALAMLAMCNESGAVGGPKHWNSAVICSDEQRAMVVEWTYWL